jgi:putative ABC transport system substrate-binding protein
VRRRDFITLIGGAAAAPVLSPLAARAQQPALPLVGFLRSTPAAPFWSLVTALWQGLNDQGFIEGQNAAVEQRWADNQPDRLPAMVTALLGRNMSVMVGDNISALAAEAVTTRVPIVFVTGGDPVKSGLVASLNRPGGNVTGISFFSGELGSKRLELLLQLAPRATTIAVVTNPSTPTGEAERRDVQDAAKAIGKQLIDLTAASDSDIERDFATISQRQADALLVGGSAFLNSRTELIVALAAQHKLPTIYFGREAVLAGGLMSYGTSLTDAYRQAGRYAGRILKGEKPADLPVMRSTKFEFLLNLKTAKALGLTVPPTLLALADEVIE